MDVDTDIRCAIDRMHLYRAAHRNGRTLCPTKRAAECSITRGPLMRRTIRFAGGEPGNQGLRRRDSPWSVSALGIRNGVPALSARVARPGLPSNAIR